MRPALSRTAAISATSHSLPRVSAGSARPGRADEDVVAACRERSGGASRQLSRSSRFTRLRATAEPTERGTARPSRGSPSGSSVAREPVQDEVAARDRAAAAVDGVEVLRPGEPVAALHRCSAQDRNPRARLPSARKPLKAAVSRPLGGCGSRRAPGGQISHRPHLTRRGACALSRDGASGSRDPRGRTSARGTRGAASCGERSADRCVSRLWSGSEAGSREYRRPFSDPGFPQSPGGGAGRKSLLTWRPRRLFEQHTRPLPHLWIRVWMARKSLQIAPYFHPQLPVERGSAKGAMLAASRRPLDARGRVEHPAETPSRRPLERHPRAVAGHPRRVRLLVVRARRGRTRSRGQHLVVEVPNDFTRDWIDGHLLDAVGRAASESTAGHARLLHGRGARPHRPAEYAEPAPERASEPVAELPARRARRSRSRSTRSTPSTSSSSARRTASPMQPRSQSPKRRRRRTTRCSSTAEPGSARRTCCRRSGTTSASTPGA